MIEPGHRWQYKGWRIAHGIRPHLDVVPGILDAPGHYDFSSLGFRWTRIDHGIIYSDGFNDFGGCLVMLTGWRDTVCFLYGLWRNRK